MNCIQSLIEQRTNRRIRTQTPLSGGCISGVFLVEFEDRERCVLKNKPASGDENTLVIEARMLEYLEKHSELPVPGVIDSDRDFLLLSYIENDGRTNHDSENQAGQAISKLHRVHQEGFGLEFTSVLAGFTLENQLHSSWVDFFRDARLLPFARNAHQSHSITSRTFERIQKLSSQLQNYLSEPEKPSLIHGDIWSGNVLWNQGSLAGIIDPAIYYAHPEMELSFIRLFHTFSNRFFEAYQRESGMIEKDFFRIRSDLYNLIPLLVHAILFGGSYAHSIDQTLSKHGF